MGKKVRFQDLSWALRIVAFFGGGYVVFLVFKVLFSLISQLRL